MVKISGSAFGREVLPKLPDVQMDKWAEATLNKGMVTVIDPADIEPGALQLAKNVQIRHDRTSRRFGSVLLEPTQPDAFPVLKYAFIKLQDGTPYTLRFTPESVHYIDAGSWQSLSPYFPLNGTDQDRFNLALVLNQAVFTNNGADVIQLIDFINNEHKPLINNDYQPGGFAPNFRFVCGFNNRVVCAALRDQNEVLVAWSGDGNIQEFDPLVDESAGSGPLVDSPSDLSDYITGLHAWTNSMMVLREKSVWVATKQPIPQFPFNFHSVVPGLGCDCPYTAINAGDCLIWFDYRSRSVYSYSVSGEFNALAGMIENVIAKNINNLEGVFAGYNFTEYEYTLFIPAVGSDLVQAWTYNRRNKSWCYNEYPRITCFDFVEVSSSGVTIDALVGNIDDLSGTINSLSPANVMQAQPIFGRNDGSGAIVDPNTSIDADFVDDYNTLGRPYETELISKVFTIPEDDVYIAEIRLEVLARGGGTFRIEYSRTGGEGIDPWRVAKTVTPQVLNVSRLIKYRRMIKCRRFAWRLVAEGGLFDVMSYEVHVYRAGKSHT